MAKFSAAEGQGRRNFRLIYRRDEYAFTVEPYPVGTGTSIVINEVELHFDQAFRVICATGYCPYHGWKATNLSPPDFSPGFLEVYTTEKIVKGAGIGLNSMSQRWPVFQNPEGWVCLGNPEAKGTQAVEFATGSVAVLDGEDMIALWLHPEKGVLE